MNFAKVKHLLHGLLELLVSDIWKFLAIIFTFLGECLKVRNMFEKNDPTIDLERYKRIIFEWCSGVNGILHVDLDRSEGWLYVKCKDKESAGQGKSVVFIL